MNLPETWNRVIDTNVAAIQREEDRTFLESFGAATISATWSPPSGFTTTNVMIDNSSWDNDLTWNIKSSPSLDRKKIIKELKQWREALRFADVDKIVIKTKHHKVTVRFKND